MNTKKKILIPLIIIIVVIMIFLINFLTTSTESFTKNTSVSLEKKTYNGIKNCENFCEEKFPRAEAGYFSKKSFLFGSKCTCKLREYYCGDGICQEYESKYDPKTDKGCKDCGKIKYCGSTECKSNQFTPSTAKQKLLEYFKQKGYFKQELSISNKTELLINIDELNSAVYEVKLNISSQEKTEKKTYYITKDLQFLFTSLKIIDYRSNLAKEELKELVIDSIKEIPIDGPINSNLKNITDSSITDTRSGVYKVDISYNHTFGHISMEKEFTTFVTKDGEFLFPSVPWNLRGFLERKKHEEKYKKAEEKPIPKSEKPKVELFMMSLCKYGNKAENTMKPVYEKLEDKVQWKPHYIVSEKNGEISSLYGQIEVKQDKRELCVLEDYGIGKWFEFVTYVNDNCWNEGEHFGKTRIVGAGINKSKEDNETEMLKEGCWEKAISEINITVDEIKTCVDENGTKMLEEEVQIIQNRNVSASPTLFINGANLVSFDFPKYKYESVIYQYGDSEAYKTAICSAFETKPDECSQTLK